MIRAEPPPAKTVRYIPDADEGPTTAEYCLYEDVRYGMIPSLMRADARLEIACMNITASEVVQFFEPGYGYGQHRQADELVHVLEATAVEIVRCAARAFEIRDGGEGPLAITPIASGTWRVIGGELVQQTPKTDAIEGTPLRIILSPSDFGVISSSQLSAKTAGKMWREIRQLDFASSAVMRQFDPRVDLSRSQAINDVAMLKASAPIGWLPRPNPENMIDHYFAFRTLKFRRCLSTLRADILNGMNEVLRTLGERRGFAASVSIRGLKAAGEFQSAIDDLLAGRVGPSIVKDFW